MCIIRKVNDFFQRYFSYTEPLQTITRKKIRTEFCRTLRWKNHSKSELNYAKLFTRLLNFTLSEFSQFVKTELYAEFSQFTELTLNRNLRKLRICKTQALCGINSDLSNLSGILKTCSLKCLVTVCNNVYKKCLN